MFGNINGPRDGRDELHDLMFGSRRDSMDRIIFIVGAVAIVLLFVTVVRNRSASSTLSVYAESNVVEAAADDADAGEAADFETAIYTYGEGFSIAVPADWERVTKSGWDTYVHAPSGSSVQVQVFDYDPSVNNVSAEEESLIVAGDGKTFVSFTRTSNSSYDLRYQDYQMSTYDYVEEVYWDREHIIKLVCTFNDAYYERMAPYYEYILNSFGWMEADPIPDGLTLCYIEAGDFEFAYPSGWTIGSSSNAIVASDSTYSASMTVTLSDFNGTLDSLTSTDIAGLVGNGRSGYMLNSYETSALSATATSTYIYNNVQYVNRLYLFTNGLYLYGISFDYEPGMIEDGLPDECASLFREFVTDKINAEIEKESDAGEAAGADGETVAPETDGETVAPEADGGEAPDGVEGPGEAGG